MRRDTDKVAKFIYGFNLDYKDKGGWDAFEKIAIEDSAAAAGERFGFSREYAARIFAEVHGQGVEEYRRLRASLENETGSR